jgi:hypothetical protein
MNEPLPPCDTEIPAKIYVGDRFVSTGRAVLISPENRGLYWPEDAEHRDIPYLGVNLRLSGKDDAIVLAEIHQCTAMASRLHYHFQIAP